MKVVAAVHRRSHRASQRYSATRRRSGGRAGSALEAIIGVGEFTESDPLPVWEFIRRWAPVADEDLQAALATCLLEHLLEYRFELIFPLVDRAARSDRSIAGIIVMCAMSGDAADPGNAAALEKLKRECSAPAI